MSNIDQALDLIRSTDAALGTLEFSRVAGVPYTTLREAKERAFSGKSVDVLKKLEAAARLKDVRAQVAKKAAEAKSGEAA